jgi:hypothetical protein
MTEQEVKALRAKTKVNLDKAAKNLAQIVDIDVLTAAVEFAKQMQVERENHR